MEQKTTARVEKTTDEDYSISGSFTEWGGLEAEKDIEGGLEEGGDGYLKVINYGAFGYPNSHTVEVSWRKTVDDEIVFLHNEESLPEIFNRLQEQDSDEITVEGKYEVEDEEYDGRIEISPAK